MIRKRPGKRDCACWSPFPAAVNRFHSRIQDEALHRFYVELLAAGAFAPAALTALRRYRRGFHVS